MWWDEGPQENSPISSLLLTVPVIWMGTHGCVPQWQVPETHPDHPNPSSHIHSRSDNSWCAGSFPASPFIRPWNTCQSLCISQMGWKSWSSSPGVYSTVEASQTSALYQYYQTLPQRKYWFPRVGPHLELLFIVWVMVPSRSETIKQAKDSSIVINLINDNW